MNVPSTVNAAVLAQADPWLEARIIEVVPLVEGELTVRAGSALVSWQGRLLAVQDDALAAVWIDPANCVLEPLVFAGAGERLRKKEKPDFEAALVTDDGMLYVLGSGASPQRRRIARVNLRQASSSPELLDASALYDAAAQVLGELPNIEGALLKGDSLWLFHRGVRGGSMLVEMQSAALDGQPCSVLSHRRCDLGSVGAVALGFTDAIRFDAERMLYLAAAENTTDAIADGEIVGAAIGIISDDAARYAPLLERDGRPSRRKVEGVVLNADRRSGWLLTDPDDPDQPAELCAFTLSGPWWKRGWRNASPST